MLGGLGSVLRAIHIGEASREQAEWVSMATPAPCRRDIGIGSLGLRLLRGSCGDTGRDEPRANFWGSVGEWVCRVSNHTTLASRGRVGFAAIQLPAALDLLSLCGLRGHTAVENAESIVRRVAVPTVRMLVSTGPPNKRLEPTGLSRRLAKLAGPAIGP